MNTNNCVKCGQCKSKCEFLKKYDMDLNDMETLRPELSYECFLCGECKKSCPVDIDGREVALSLRRKFVSSGKLDRKVYSSILYEKKDYIFRNYISKGSPVVLFPGCNFPSFFPNTTDKLVKLLKSSIDIDIYFDCCGKPIAELGMENEEKRIVKGINDRLKSAKVKQLITLCPNCYCFLKGKLDVEVVDIYKKLYDIGYEPKLEKNNYNIFLPCPDREEREIFKSIEKFINKESTVNFIEDVQCCGLGGLAACRDKKVPELLTSKLREKGYENVYTYCATCHGNFIRSGIESSQHFLIHMLKTSESFPKGFSYVINRAKFKFKKY